MAKPEYAFAIRKVSCIVHIYASGPCKPRRGCGQGGGMEPRSDAGQGVQAAHGPKPSASW